MARSASAKHRVVYPLEKRVVNPVVMLAWRLGIPPPGDALLETTGRRTGRPRRTPICDGLDGEVFWLVAQRGRRADWVRNIAANPRVRVRVRSESGSAGGPERRTSSTRTTRASGSGLSAGAISRAGSACAPPRRWAPAR
jgi:deazaflavin-dependent oxidoreductase (nitroreductase family)